MLTREEAIYLAGELREKYMDFKDGTLNKNFIDVIYGIVKQFTEKPKTQAKVGYYYKDGHGNLEMVTEISSIRISTDCKNYYLLDGTEFDGIDPRNALNLSTPYKLVEVENVD